MALTETNLDPETIAALLAWQAELGAEEPVGDTPVNRYDLPSDPPWSSRETIRSAEKKAAAPSVQAALPTAKPETEAEPVAEAQRMAAKATTLADLAEIQSAYEHCELKRGARKFVFADGNPAARVMVVGEAPGSEEDRMGRPFVGPAGQLLDRMFAAIGLARTSPDPAASLYITNVMPWRPPQNREPEPQEMAMMLPFLKRHIELAGPDMLVLMGNTPCSALLGQRGILKLRGKWTEVLGRPTLPMTHPSYLLRTPSAKREAWADLLSLKARLGNP